jgi:hypothetical protein
MSERSNDSSIPPDGGTKANADRKPGRNTAKKATQEKKAKVNQELAGFEIGINTFGEISSNFSVERINAFLNAHVPDKRLNEAAPEADTEDAKGSSHDAE